MPAVPVKSLFHSGGTLERHHIYVKRDADQKLLESLRAGRYSHVLAPRQVGKSSLWAHVQSQLPAEMLCVKIDLNGVTDSSDRAGGKGIDDRRSSMSSEEVARIDKRKSEWYIGIINRIYLALFSKYENLRDQFKDPHDFWVQSQGSISARFSEYFLTQLLPDLPKDKKICICIDEIDNVQSLPFSGDEFFTAIRYLYNNRDTFRILERISFCLLGSASPTQLMDNIDITPFNIEDRVELTHFNFKEAEVFCEAWKKVGVEGDLTELLAAIMGWTNGHPYMTHKLCERVAEEGRRSAREDAMAWVDRIVQAEFLGRPLKDPLSHAERRILGHPRQFDLLLLWEEILKQRRIAKGQHRFKQYEESLILSGLALDVVDDRNRYLTPSNKIFEHVFNTAWVAPLLIKDELRIVYEHWLKSGKNPAHLPLRPQFDRFTERVFAQALAPDIQEFLDLANQRDQQIKGQNDRRNALLAFLLILVVIVTSAAVVLFTKLDEQKTKKRLDDNETASMLAENVGVQSQQAHVLADAVLMLSRYRQQGESPPPRALSVLMQAAHKPYWQQIGNQFPDSVRSVSFSPDNNTLLVASAQHVYLLDINSQRLTVLGEKEHQSNTITHVDYSPNGERIVTASMDGVVRAWIANNRELKFRRTGHARAVLFAIYSPNSQFIVSTGLDQTAQIWDVNLLSERRAKFVLPHSAQVNSAAFSMTGQYLVTACSDGSISVWETATGQRKARFLVSSARTSAGDSLISKRSESGGSSLGEHGINTVLIAPNDSAIVTGGNDGIIRFFRFLPKPQGGWSKWESKPLAGHTGRVLSLAYSPDKKTLVSTSADHTVRLWDVDTQEVDVLYGHSDEVLTAAYSHDGQRLVTGGREGIIRLWHLHRRAVRTFRGPVALSVAASPTQSKIATANEDLTARIWNLDTGKLELSLLGHRGPVRGIAYSPDGKNIATASADKTVLIWTASEGKRIETLDRHSAVVSAVAFSNDGKYLLSASEDRRVWLWDAKTYTAIRSILHPSSVLAAAFSTNSQYIAAALEGGSVVISDVQSGKDVSSLPFSPGPVLAVAFSTDDRLLAASNRHGDLQIWKLSTGQILAEDHFQAWRAHEGALYSLAFSPKGELLTTGADRFVKIWDSQGGKLLLSSRDYSEAIRRAIYLGSGDWVVAATLDGIVKVTPGSLNQYLKVACNLLANEKEYKDNFQLRIDCQSYVGQWP